ncbi:F0F1 ATP synthase subunit delta [Thermoflavimicrobium daqui]|uniref:ATP synthase subunit delta n=1 Tax=Thermoflavimicrobium daqui TaxID=2137476 RepID=A0A364K3A4_9BACL|nr:F0F1 ATP synthase subunit delta [Thermoflavimicrobium daqui]RAL23317.1 F0F1 ATP synthase subunit delta [Thermoflavimicrobium daqui]
MSVAVAKRYAKALFEIASERNILDQLEQELTLIVETFSSLPTLHEWLSHPLTEVAKKKELFSSVFSHLSETARNFLFLLTDRHREGLIGEIMQEYKQLVHEARGIADATVTSATPLTDKEKEELIQIFHKLIGKQLLIENVVDSDILGGVIVQVGDRLYDGSLKTKLVRFKERLQENRVG